MSVTLEDISTGRIDLSEVVEAARAKPAPVTPGEILAEEFMRPLGLSMRQLASALDVPVNRISQIVRAQRSITAGTALRLARYFGTTPELWLNLQSHYELQRAAESEGDLIRRHVQPRVDAA